MNTCIIFKIEFFCFSQSFLLFFSKVAKNLTSRAFSWRKHAKSMRNSCLNLGFVRILARWLWHMSSSSGFQLVVILWVRVVPQCVQGLGVMTPHHSDAWPECDNRLRSDALLRSLTMFAPRLVLYNHKLCPVNLGHISEVFFEISIMQDVLRSDLRILLCRDLLPWSQLEPWGPSKTHAHAEIL